ncbi:MAG: PEP-CTERM sorting domain-containing protein [Candidatus Korobacteraceae bacterium]
MKTQSSQFGQLQHRGTMSYGMIVALVAMLLTGAATRVRAAEFTAGTPTNPVQSQDTLVLKKQLCPNCPPVTIRTFIPPGITAAAKASLISAQATSQGVPNTLSGNDVKFIGYEQISYWSSSMETSSLQLGPQVDDYNGPYCASLGYDLNQGYFALTGLNGDGMPANYTAGFGLVDSVYGNINLSTSVDFSDLSAPTIVALLTAEYNALDAQLLAQAPGLAGDLVLNLNNDTIDFAFPSTELDGSVTSGNTDLGLTATGSLEATPEPSSLLLVGSGVVGLSGLLRKQFLTRS